MSREKRVMENKFGGFGTDEKSDCFGYCGEIGNAGVVLALFEVSEEGR